MSAASLTVFGLVTAYLLFVALGDLLRRRRAASAARPTHEVLVGFIREPQTQRLLAARRRLLEERAKRGAR